MANGVAHIAPDFDPVCVLLKGEAELAVPVIEAHELLGAEAIEDELHDVLQEVIARVPENESVHVRILVSGDLSCLGIEMRVEIELAIILLCIIIGTLLQLLLLLWLWLLATEQEFQQKYEWTCFLLRLLLFFIIIIISGSDQYLECLCLHFEQG